MGTMLKLTAMDRCDRCGAQAYVEAKLKPSSALLFCAHHAKEHLPKLLEAGYTVLDETGRLTPVKVASNYLT